MEESSLNMRSPYAGSCIIIPTKHAKSIAIAPPFWKWLEASMLEWNVDTDTLGTFSGEVERQGNALACARKKCEWAADSFNVDFALASEGSFGPHPFIPFLPCDQEILYFIDRKRCFHLHMVHLSEKTNYQMQALDSLEELQKFAEAAQFPSHALIMQPNDKKDHRLIFKGVDTQEALAEAFRESVKHSSDGKAWVETDMRAQYNPSRMEVIAELADKMAQRLATPCPKCGMPGWGRIKVQKGLECAYCGTETKIIKTEIFGCVSCSYEENKGRADGMIKAEPGNCPCCNP